MLLDCCVGQQPIRAGTRDQDARDADPEIGEILASLEYCYTLP